MSGAAGSGKKYVSVYEKGKKGNARAFGSAARKNISTGELMVKCLEDTQEALERYKVEHGRAGSAATGARASNKTLKGLASKVFSNYIRYAIAQDKHGEASAAAPRMAGELSQVQEYEENMGFFGRVIRMKVGRGGLSVSEEREINAIVKDNAEEAAEYGLTEGGSNLGPDVDVDKAKAKIASELGAGQENPFEGGRRRSMRKTTRKVKKSRKSKKASKKTRRH